MLRGMDQFNFAVGDVVLAEWEDKLFYAKIQKIDKTKSYCHLIFDDNSVEECPFSKIHSVTETTAEIVCIICKDGTSTQPNEIVLCDKCGIGYHQTCHEPAIPAKALEIDEPWMCAYCSVGAFCPYLENPFEAKEKRADQLRRREIQPLSGENSVVGNALNSQGVLQKAVKRSMSGIYYTSPSQHREGSRPRGRPPFSHKKHNSEKKGRGVGRSPNRNQNSERDVDTEANSKKHFNKQTENQHNRYSSPSRNSRQGDEADSSGSERSHSKESDMKPTANKKENSSNKSLPSVKHHRREPPREKQRLTQDLARQKKLLSEDLARNNQILQREQANASYDGKGSDSDSAQEQYESIDDKAECSNEKETQLTMYEKCYGNYSANSPGNESTEENRRNTKSLSSKCDNNMEKSLFERMFSRNSIAESNKIEFVNESHLEMRSDEEKNDKDHVIKRPLSSVADTTSEGDLNRKVKLPVFENVTDDELSTSDNETSAQLKPNEISSNALATAAKLASDINFYSSTQSQNNYSTDKVHGNITKARSPKEHISECNDKLLCDCSSVDGNDAIMMHINGNESNESDHSKIKASRMSQILDEPATQCEHSTRNETYNHDGDDKDTTNQYGLNNVNDNEIIESIGKINHDDNNREDIALDELDNSKDLENASIDTDVSNNEGMSDAEELSDVEPVTSSGKNKIKRKTRKKPKSSKNVTKITNSPQKQSRRSKTGRRLGRPPKVNKQARQMDSDSDEQEHCDNKEHESIELSAADFSQDSFKQIEESNHLDENAYKEPMEDSNKDGECAADDPLSPSDSIRNQDSDTEDANQDIFSLTDAERLQYEEQLRRERARKDKRIAIRQKRKSLEKERDKDRDTPPHLVSQNRFARDLPRHNWLVERLLQQKKLGQEALKRDENENSDNAEGNSDDETKVKDDETTNEANNEDDLDTKSTDSKTFTKELISESGDSLKEEPSSPVRDDFQSELHRSFLRRSFPPNVPRSPPKLKPASPESTSENKPLAPPLKHKLHSKEHVLEPIPKLKKIVPEKAKESDHEDVVKQDEENNDSEVSKETKESASSRKQDSPIEIIDDEEEKKKTEKDAETKDTKPSISPVLGSAFSTDKLLSKDEDNGKRSSFSPLKKPLGYPLTKKTVHSVSPTLPGKELPGPHPMGPHHRAAILIPVAPMHDANGLPIPPSLGPPSPHMKPYSPRTFTPHLITHNPPFSTSGLFSGPSHHRYPPVSCHHHFQPGMKPGPCKRDVNCPFHGSPTRTLPSGILGLPSHHPPSMAPFNSPHEHISQMLAREREHREGHCPNNDCKMCRQGKESPKIRELDSQSSSDKKSPQPSKVVKPIAHVPGMRPPLMLSHLQQFGIRPGHSFPDIDTIQEEKARRSGLDPILSPRAKRSSSSPDRPSREPLVPGLFSHERRPLPQSLTLSDLNRRREQELLKGPLDPLKRRSLPGDFLVPGFSPPSSLNKPGLIHPKDAALFSGSRSQPGMTSQNDKRDLQRLEERERSSFLGDPLKGGPPRLRPLDEKMDAHALRLNEQNNREDLRRDSAPILRQPPPPGKEGLPPAKLFEEREVSREQSRDPSVGFTRPNKEFEMRLLSSHGNSSILGPGMRNLDENRKVSEEERKGLTREEREQEARRSVESETRERELREEQAMNALEASHRRSMEQIREKEQEKRAFAERESMRGLTPLERDRMKQQLLRGPDAERHLKTAFGISRDRSPPFLRREMYLDRLLDPSKGDHRMEIRGITPYELQRRQELFRATEGSHRELLGRLASNYSATKSTHPGEKPFPERFHPEISRPIGEIGGHSPTRGYPLSLASRQAMDRLAAAAQGKSLQMNKDMDKEMPLHLRTEIEREREKERHRLSLEQIDVNRRLLQAELKEKVNPLVLNREIGPRDREKEMEALRVRERLMIERERHMAMERLMEERKRKRNAGELDGPFLIGGRHLSPSSPYGRALSEFERAKRMRMDEHMLTPSSYGSLMAQQSSNSFDSKLKEDRLSSPKGAMEPRLGRPLDLDLANKTGGPMADREALFLRERERVMRAKEELSRLQPKPTHTSHHPAAFASAKERPDPVPRDGAESSGKTDEDGVNSCSVCKREASFLCSGCQGAWYCSTECQLSAWAKHSRECSQSQRQ